MLTASSTSDAPSIDWAGFPPTQYRLPGRRFYRSKDPTNSIKVLKEHNNTQITQKYNKHTYTHTHIQKTQQIP